jgi:hypothetical protein
MKPQSLLTMLLIAVAAVPAYGFSNSLFQEAPRMQRTAPSKKEGVDIELPDFNELFERIQQVSPLARSVITGDTVNGQRGFKGVDDKSKFP